MALNVTVVVGTFGRDWWRDLARTRAIPSAERLGVPVLHTHADTLHDARNGGLGLVETEWVTFLDADDELERGYFDAMETGSADVRAPAVRYIHPGGANSTSKVPTVAGHRHPCTAECLAFGNWLVIGALVRADLVRGVGGFRDFAWSEDWDLWLRCHQAGATFEAIPAAVYKAHVRKDSRNRGAGHEAKLAAHRAIAVANGVPVP